MTKCRALVVEAEVLVAMLTEDMLEELGFDVCGSVGNLCDGLQIAAKGIFDIAVLDVNLHGVYSYTIAEVLKQRGIPYIFVSGYTAHGLEAGYRDTPIVQKPFTADTLRRALFDMGVR